MLVWAKNGYEQNLVLEQSPPTPESFGFSSATTRLQFWTAMDSCPVPTREGTFTLKSGLVDQVLYFSDCWFPVGAAFGLGGSPLPPAGEALPVKLIDPSAPDVLPTAKSLVNIGGATVLVEEINYNDLLTVLSAMPRAAMTPPRERVVELADRVQLLPKFRPSGEPPNPVLVASSPYVANGLVWDYPQLLSGTSNSCTFAANSTYYISNSFAVTSSAIFNTNVCIKYGSNATFTLSEASVSFPSTGLPVVFTSKDDDTYGEVLTNSTSLPSYAAAKALWIYNRLTSTTVQNAVFHWAQQGIHYTEETGAGLRPQLNSTVFQDCSTGVFLDIGNDTLYLSGDSYCVVPTPINRAAGSVYGSMTVCTATTNLLVDASQAHGIEGEPSIAVNPTDPQNLFMAANMNPDPNSPTGEAAHGARSTNGGTNWSSFNRLPGTPLGDPSLAFDTFGNLFVSCLLQDFSVLVLLSTDKGYSFVTSKVYQAAVQYDHPELTVGPGSVWLTFYDFATTNSVVAGVGVSGLGSVGTWATSPTVIANTGADPGAQYGYGYGWGDIAVGPSGQVALVVHSGANQNGPSEIRLSTNLYGLAQPANFSSASAIATSQVGFFQSIPAQAGRKIAPTPGLAWDRTGGPYRARLYMVYTDRPVGNLTNTDIYVTYSTNNGTSWSTALKVNTDSTSSSQFFPRIAVDQTSGKVAVSWYDCRDDPNNVRTRFYLAVSGDGGVTFSPNIPLETHSSDATVVASQSCQCIVGCPDPPTTLDYFDYTGLAFYGGFVYPAWADNSISVAGNPNPDYVTGMDTNCGMDINVAKVQY
jgi:hypothetical protein